MTSVRDARAEDVAAIRAFGEAYIPLHYTPLIGASAAAEQVRQWWSLSHLAEAVASGRVVVASSAGRLVGVGQRGRYGDDHVIYKLYVAPDHRGTGLGPRLISALVAQLPTGVDRVYIEHVASNTRAAAFYEREGFTVERLEPSSTGDPALAIVWRVRPLQPPPAGPAAGE